MYKIAIVEDDDAMAKQLEEYVRLYGTERGLQCSAGSFGDGTVGDIDLAAALQGAVIKEDDKDSLAWKEYLENVMKKRGEGWFGLYAACRELLP